ncbi:MAG: alginate lyase family protein [Magnetococcales bacterium]|nr:alginate lyase family protein [Magnetococcales bacterium]
MDWHRLAFYLKRAVELPPHVTIQRAGGRLMHTIRQRRNQKRDQQDATYATSLHPSSPLLHRHLSAIPSNTMEQWIHVIQHSCQNTFNRQFNLLGSGWQSACYGSPCPGIEGITLQDTKSIITDCEGNWLSNHINASNLAESQRIWRLISSNHLAIDWQRDFKSGYRWNACIWYGNTPHGHVAGADIKIPWELARMQFLTTLALGYTFASDGHAGFDTPERYRDTFRDIVLDFMATNPPRYGVNWFGTMEVAIRAVNWLVAYDLFRASGVSFDAPFEKLFHRSIHEHGLHIVNNLEWHPSHRGNHYLADLAGLLFIAAYLPCGPESDVWLALAVQELNREIMRQFNDDGGNFEGSTSYHRLSGEMALFCMAMMSGLSKEKREALTHYDHRLIQREPLLNQAPLTLHKHPDRRYPLPFSYEMRQRVERAARFTLAMTHNDGTVAQIGDNDSGRFLKLHPDPIEHIDSHAPSTHERWNQNHQHLLSATRALINLPEMDTHSDRFPVDERCIAALSNGISFPACTEPCPPVQSTSSGITVGHFPEFGISIHRTERLTTTVRCGPLHPEGNGGHAHNDQLAITVMVDDQPLFVDAGSCLYTALPNIRKAFRSVQAHNTLVLDDLEPNPWTAGNVGLFQLDDNAKGDTLTVEPEHFVGKHVGYGITYRRALSFEHHRIIGHEQCHLTHPGYVMFLLAPHVRIRKIDKQSVTLQVADRTCHLVSESGHQWRSVDARVSPGYGCCEETTALHLMRPDGDSDVRWSLTLQ